MDAAGGGAGSAATDALTAGRGGRCENGCGCGSAAGSSGSVVRNVGDGAAADVRREGPVRPKLRGGTRALACTDGTTDCSAGEVGMGCGAAKRGMPSNRTVSSAEACAAAACLARTSRSMRPSATQLSVATCTTTPTVETHRCCPCEAAPHAVPHRRSCRARRHHGTPTQTRRHQHPY
jgi:hypothetical protein